MSRRQIGHKAKLEVDHDDDTTFTEIGDIKKITPVGAERGTVDVTVLADDVVQNIDDGPQSLSEMVFELADDPDDAAIVILEDLQDDGSGTICDWKYTLPYSTPIVYQFKGWVRSFQRGDAESKTQLRATVIVVPTTKPVKL